MKRNLTNSLMNSSVSTEDQYRLEHTIF